jgi:hypothetical protein
MDDNFREIIFGALVWRSGLMSGLIWREIFVSLLLSVGFGQGREGYFDKETRRGRVHMETRRSGDQKTQTGSKEIRRPGNQDKETKRQGDKESGKQLR